MMCCGSVKGLLDYGDKRLIAAKDTMELVDCRYGRWNPSAFSVGRLCPEVQPFTLLYTILTEKVSLLYTGLYWKVTPFIYLNPLTPGTFCKKCVSWTFWWFLGWISAKLALIQSKMRLQTWLGHAQKSKCWDVTHVFRLFEFLEFFFAFPFSPVFAAVIDLLLLGNF